MLTLSATLTMLLLLASNIHAADIKLTLYDDGLSCPENCDAHVVFHSALNGTKHAHAPVSPPGQFA